MSPRDQDLLSTVPHTGPAVYTKPVLRSTGEVGEIGDELSESYDSDEESVGPAEEAFGHTKEPVTSYLGLTTDYLASFKAAQLGLKAADGVLDTLDRATRCEDDCKEVDCIESLPVQKFGDMNFDAEVYNSEDDSDYCPSEDCEEDLEYDSEAEVSDAEAEVVCEKAKANTFVRSLQRQCRAVRRAGTKRAGSDRPVHTIGEASLVGAICETFNMNFFLSVVGLKLEPVNKIIFKQVTHTEEDEDHTEVTFSQLSLKGYDSAEDADYCPGESEEDSDLEYDSEAEISEESDEELLTEVEMTLHELDFKDHFSEEDQDYFPSESDDEELETFTKPVLRSSAAKLNDGLDMKDYEEDAAYKYDSDETDSSEESDEEVSEEEVPTQMFGEMNFEDYNSGEDSAFCPGEAEKYREAKTFKLVLRNSASAAGINTGLVFQDYVEDADYCSSESEEEDSDSDTEISEESDEELHIEEVEMPFHELNFKDYVSEEDQDYCPSESDDVECEIFAKPVLRNSASAAEINTGLIFQDYEEDVDYSSSESEEDSSEYDSDAEVSEETDEDY